MSEPAEDILHQALRLSPSDRAEVAAELLASLDGAPDLDAEALWAVEIRHRIERVRDGKATGRPCTLVKDDVQRRDP